MAVNMDSTGKVDVQVKFFHIGVALLVSNDYSSNQTATAEKAVKELSFTHSDSNGLAQVFTELFKYKVYQKKNLSIENFIKCCKDLAEYKYPSTCKRIVVYFSGHGADADNLVFQDGGQMSVTDVVTHFKPNIAGNNILHDIVRVFLIDACRGTKTEEGRFLKCTQSQNLLPSVESNILVAHASLPRHVACGGPGGSRWTNCLIDAIHKSDVGDNIFTVLTVASKLMKEKNTIANIQTGEFTSSLLDTVHFKQEAVELKNKMEGVKITHHPENVTVKPNKDAKFKCVVNTANLCFTNVGWQIKKEEKFVPAVESDRHEITFTTNGSILTGVLIVKSVLPDDDGKQYRCQPVPIKSSNIALLKVNVSEFSIMVTLNNGDRSFTVLVSQYTTIEEVKEKIAASAAKCGYLHVYWGGKELTEGILADYGIHGNYCSLKAEQEEEKSSETEGDLTDTSLPMKFHCFKLTDTTKIAMGVSGITILEPITIPHFIEITAKKLPQNQALCWKDNKENGWLSLTYSEYLKCIYNAAKSFLKLGLEPYHSVGIIGFNSKEWFISSMGAVFAGGLSTGIHTTNSQENCCYILEYCKANIVVVENKEQLEKILAVCHKLPHLKAIVQYKGELSKNYPNTYTWEKFLEMGQDLEDSIIKTITSRQQPDQCSMLVYTSGTTSTYKGVMLSHDNVTWVINSLLDTLGNGKWKFGQERVVSYLPLSHLAGMIIDMFLTVKVGGTVYFVEPDALKGSLVDYLKDIKPTFFFGVPSVWEKMKTILKGIESNNHWIVGAVTQWGKQANQQGKNNPLVNFVIRTFAQNLGLSECKYMMVGAAPILRDTLKYFRSVLKVPLLELYGMSECTGPQTLGLESDKPQKNYSCGKKISGTEMKIDSPNDNGSGEVLLRGRHVFMGYLGMEKETKSTIDSERWLHSGDVGHIDEDGFLYIDGRIKELITMANGEEVFPVFIENRIKSEISFLSNVMVVGDQKDYLTCLLTLKCVINADTGEATDYLQPQVIKMFKGLGCECETVSEVIETKNKAVNKAIVDGITRCNSAQNIAHTLQIRNWIILDSDFTIPGGELGPTLKLLRQEVMKKYHTTIDTLYI